MVAIARPCAAARCGGCARPRSYWRVLLNPWRLAAALVLLNPWRREAFSSADIHKLPEAKN